MKGHKNSCNSGLLHCGAVKGAVLLVLKQGLSVSDTKGLKKGRDTHMFLSDVCMLACVFVYACVDMYSRFRNAQRLDWQCFRRKHMFSADRAGERGE